MDPAQFKNVLNQEVGRVLPHLLPNEIEDVTDFLIGKGCKKERDLRIMTIPLLETHLDLVDATDLFTEWQRKYGDDQSSKSQTTEPPRSRGVLSERQLVENFQMPQFDKDSPYVPSKVRQAILELKRPSPRDREDMVARIVDHCRESVPNLKRCMFNSVADFLVTNYPQSFKDTLPVSELGSESLRSQLKNKFDNDKRPSKYTLKEKECPNIPSAYGCTSWSPPLPDGESEETQQQKKIILQDLFRLSKKQWDWKVIRGHIEATFYLQRKEINGPEAEVSKSVNKKRKRNSEAVEEAVAGEQSKMTVPQLREEWPFLFKARGLNCHFKKLTGVDFKEKFNRFIKEEGLVLIEYLACKDENQAKLRRKMLRAETRSFKTPAVPALLQMLILHFKENLDSMFTYVEETLTFQEVQETAKYPADGTPSIIALGKNLFSSLEFYITVGQQVVASASSLEEAFCMMFSFFFLLNIQYSSSLECFLTFVQRVIAEINPERGTKGTPASQRKTNQKVLRLSNGLEDFKQKIGDEENEENK